MDGIYRYAILRAIPDARRGEIANIGVVVFLEDRLDIRILESRKATALSGRVWDSFIHEYAERLKSLDHPGTDEENRISRFRIVDGQISMSELGWFSATEDQYEKRLSEVTKTLVLRPRQTRNILHSSKINTEISAMFKAADVLASSKEDLASGRVVRQFNVNQQEGLVADFALQNGALHIAATLDLRSAEPRLGQAALKAVTLDKAKRSIGRKTKTFGVYAVSPERKGEVSEHIALLGDYADDVFNWSDPNEMGKFQKIFFDAFNSNHPSPLKLT